MEENGCCRFECGVVTIARNPESASFDRDLQIAAPHRAQFDLDHKLAHGGNEDVGIGNPRRMTTGCGTRHWLHSEVLGRTRQTVMRPPPTVKLSEPGEHSGDTFVRQVRHDLTARSDSG